MMDDRKLTNWWHEWVALKNDVSEPKNVELAAAYRGLIWRFYRGYDCLEWGDFNIIRQWDNGTWKKSDHQLKFLCILLLNSSIAVNWTLQLNRF